MQQEHIYTHKSNNNNKKGKFKQQCSSHAARARSLTRLLLAQNLCALSSAKQIKLLHCAGFFHALTALAALSATCVLVSGENACARRKAHRIECAKERSSRRKTRRRSTAQTRVHLSLHSLSISPPRCLSSTRLDVVLVVVVNISTVELQWKPLLPVVRLNGRALIRAQTCTRTYIDASTNNKTHGQTHELALAHTHTQAMHKTRR